MGIFKRVLSLTLAIIAIVGMLSGCKKKKGEETVQHLVDNEQVYSNSNSLKIIASGSWLQSADATDWGLSHPSDVLDLGEYEQYMTADYVWTFTISVSIEEDDDGYQEVYLYNGCASKGSVNNSDVYTESVAKDYGLLGAERFINHSSGSSDKFTRDVVFNVSGADCREEMCVRYGAHGDFSDDWYRTAVKVSITIDAKKDK